MSTEPKRTCPICGNEFSGAMEFCPVCMLRKGLADGVESGESSSGDTLKPIQDHPAQRFEHYELATGEDGKPLELGRGAMGVTYKALDINLRCPVTLKVISERYLGDESARLRFLREARAAPGGFAGTPEFASPEQFAGVGVDIRSDLYALGATLWEMMTGHVMFRGSPAEVMHQHQHAPLPVEDLKDVPEPVVVLLEALLEKDPARRYELMYIAADERDVIRLRTNCKREDLYLCRLTLPLREVRTRLMEYLNRLNELHQHPECYNEVTENCTTSIRAQHPSSHRMPWDWRMLVNGFMDQMLYERHLLTGNLPFAELKQRALINERALGAGDAPDFSERIRAGAPGF